MSDLQRKVVEWLAHGDRGMSSETMAFWLAWGEKGNSRSHPYDPDDLDRCLRLLEQVPELRPLLPRMASVSDKWARLVANWERIEASHLDEVGLGWSKARRAPKTYAMMKEVLDGPGS
jgi:hypothetical protein